MADQSKAILIQSHLNNKILDIQIYHSMFEKFHQLTLPISYSELVYKLCREHFSPNPLLLSSMKRLIYTQDPALLSELEKDYEKLGEPLPLKVDIVPNMNQNKAKNGNEKPKKVEMKPKEPTLQTKELEPRPKTQVPAEKIPLETKLEVVSPK